MKRDPNFGAAGKKGYMAGRYSRKAQNLTKAQLGKAGAKAAAKRTVDIGQTRREEGKTLGPGGKPLTGTVRMGNGNVAVYKNGKRVINQAAKKAKPVMTRKDSGSGPSKPTPPTKPDKKRDTVNTRKARDTAMANRPRGNVTAKAARPAMSGTVSSAIAAAKNKPVAKPVKNQPGIADDIRRAIAGIRIPRGSGGVTQWSKPPKKK
jgi:hypothetical protein